MELNEAARRILGQHWRLIALFVALGVGVGALLHHGDVKTYTASTRLVLDTPDPTSRQESAAIADAAKAIATSPAQVRRCARRGSRHRPGPGRRRQAGRVRSSPGHFSGPAALGQRPEPRVAAAISNALAAG